MDDRAALRQPAPSDRRGWTWVGVVLVTLVACFTGLYNLGELWPVPKYDAAMNGLDALRIVQRGVTPLFFPANGGREPLFIYLQALSLGTLGVSTFALRLPGALAGALAVPALFGLGRCLLAPSQHRGLAPSQHRGVAWVPLWAALGLALSSWHVSQTRLGLRAALLPLMSIGVYWLFISGWRRDRLARLAAAGGLLGLAAYTYTAARFLPLVLLLVALPELVLRPKGGIPRRRRWLGLAALGLAALLVFAPLGWYYLGHPVMFADRAGSVMVWNVWKPGTGTSLAEELALNVRRVLGMFAGFPLPLSLGLGAGLAVALARSRQIEYRLLVIWWAVMLLPTILTIEAPHLLRSLGAAPPTYLSIGLGLATGAAWLTRHLSRKRFFCHPERSEGSRSAVRRCFAALSMTFSGHGITLAGLLLVALSSCPLWGYFHPDGADPLARIEALNGALGGAAPQTAVYLPMSTYTHPSLRFLLEARYERQADWSLAGPAAPFELVEPPKDPDLHALVRLSPDGRITVLPSLRTDWVAVRQAAAGEGRPVVDRTGTLAARLTELPASADPAEYLARPDHGASASVAGLATLTGYSLDRIGYGPTFPHLKPGGPLWINTFWQASGQAQEDYDLTVYLIDDAGRRWGQADGPPLEGVYPTSMWRPGERLADGRLLWVDPNAPAGRYWLALAFYDYSTGARLPVSGGAAPDTIRLGPLKVPGEPPAARPAGSQAQPARFGGVAELSGYRLAQEPARLRLELFWQAEAPDGADYTVFVHLLDGGGRLALGQDRQPADGGYPTGMWEPGEVIADAHTLDLGQLPAGEYRLEVGMYSSAGGQRLPVVQDGAPAADSLLLPGAIQVP